MMNNNDKEINKTRILKGFTKQEGCSNLWDFGALNKYDNHLGGYVKRIDCVNQK